MALNTRSGVALTVATALVQTS